MPLVTVPVRPSGEPIATTWSPTCTSSESPRVAAFRPEASSSLIRARSLLLSVPTTSAVYDVPSLVRTLIEEASATTWLLVTISPSEVMITPEPVDDPASEVALISTMLGLTAAATPDTVPFWLDGTTVVEDEPAEATVSPPASSCRPYAVPPPTAAATIATAASRAPGPRARRRRAGWAGSAGCAGAGAWAGGGGHSGFTRCRLLSCSPPSPPSPPSWLPLSYSPWGRRLSVMTTSLAPDDESTLSVC
jgi:hypothetical protein